MRIGYIELEKMLLDMINVSKKRGFVGMLEEAQGHYINAKTLMVQRPSCNE